MSDSLLAFCQSVMHSPITTVWLCLGLFFLVLFTVKWMDDCRKRRRERKSVTSADFKYLTPSGRGKSYIDGGAALPSVAIVMPVKGNSIKAANPIDNWRSQVMTAYKGAHEAIFVVESEDDGAIPMLEELKKELGEQASIQIIVAGLSEMCAQKIHNMVKGAEAASASMEYVLFLDANMRMHEGSINVLVETMQSDPVIFACSGFPFDIPPPGATVWAWAQCQYRYVILNQFAEHRAILPWGGCMLMRRDEIDNDVCEIKTRWLDGGYSDDLIVGGAARDFGRTIATPIRALFPNTVKKDITFDQCWDFIRRQIFTLITYSSCGHCALVTGILSLSFIGGLIPLPAFFIALFTLICGAVVEALAPDTETLTVLNLGLSLAYFVLLFLAMRLQRWYLQRCWKLAKELSPGKEITEFTLGCCTQYTSWFMQSFLAPFITLAVICTRYSVWGGIKYHARGGKIVRLERPEPTPSKAQAPGQTEMQQKV